MTLIDLTKREMIREAIFNEKFPTFLETFLEGSSLPERNRDITSLWLTVYQMREEQREALAQQQYPEALASSTQGIAGLTAEQRKKINRSVPSVYHLAFQQMRAYVEGKNG